MFSTLIYGKIFKTNLSNCHTRYKVINLFDKCNILFFPTKPITLELDLINLFNTSRNDIFNAFKITFIFEKHDIIHSGIYEETERV